MNNKKERQIKEADSFTAITHHVKSPIYVLKGYLEALSSEEVGELDEKQKRYIKICMENVDRMSFIINSLIGMMEIEEGKYEVKKEPLDIVNEIEEIVENSLPMIRASNVKVFIEKKEDSLFALTDREKFREAMDIILLNAMNYKKQNEGKIEVKIEKKENKALCSIKDNGIGISEKEKEKIFNKFYRTKEGIKIDPNSLGIGLFICKTIIELSDGKIWAEKNKEEGTTFFFTLPLFEGKHKNN